MNQSNETIRTKPNRRDLLKSASAALAAGTFGVGTTAARSSPLTTVTLVEADVTYEISDDLGEKESYPVIAADYPRLHRVDERRQQLHLSQFTSREDVSRLKRKSVVSKAIGFRKLGDSLATNRTRMLPATLSIDYRPTEELLLSRPFVTPGVALSRRPDGITVETSRNRMQVGPGEEIKHTLPSETATVTVTSSTDHQASGPENVDDWRLGTKKRRREESVTLVPTVNVRNRGQLDVVTDQRS